MLGVAIAATIGLGPTALRADGLRQTLRLDGQWQIAEGSLDQVPTSFKHSVPVPGLVDQALPAFEQPGATVPESQRRKVELRTADPRREAFWYRRAFQVAGPVAPVAMLKINKAAYGTKVYLNGHAVGEHTPNFTPGWFNVRPYLKGDGATNELIVRVGASLAQVPPNRTEGWDFEKSRYVPGIYDSVELIQCGTPRVVNVQTVPDVQHGAVRAVVELDCGAKTPAKLTAIVREVNSGRVVGRQTASASAASGAANKVDLTVALTDAHPWTPEDPFLYELEINTGADVQKTRFGLRTFTTNPETGRAILNGKPYFLRGSNVCIFRFMEDSQRGTLPWDRNWVRALHRKFKQMHWNSLRYCIGFPPELWYEIADEEGILIQDEFPVWYGGKKDSWPRGIGVDDLALEYTEWMRERWNHPCVMIWDAQNETRDDRIVGLAIQKVRGLDLSHRPWDNGWGTPQQPGDISESHPYRSSGANYRLARLAKETGIPDNGPPKDAARPPYLINEYGWLWINRDGTLPTLTVQAYQRMLGENATPDARWNLYARHLAAKTEFWRHRRKCAGVLHFCGLGYSRSDGQTSDNFIDVKHLVFEPHFADYVRDAFAPVSVMIDYWNEEAEKGQRLDLPVSVINDRHDDWSGSVRLRVVQGKRILHEECKPITVPALGQQSAPFAWTVPATDGQYLLEATLLGKGQPPVRSLRDLAVLSPEQIRARQGISAGKAVTASSNLVQSGATRPEAAVDGNLATRWSSAFSDPQWLAVDLGAVTRINRVELAWESAHAKSYAIQVSTDGEKWTDVYKTAAGKGGLETIRFAPVAARHVRVYGTQRATQFGYSLWEFRVFAE
jgi:hypothetical protein